MEQNYSYEIVLWLGVSHHSIGIVLKDHSIKNAGDYWSKGLRSRTLIHLTICQGLVVDT